MILTVMCQTLGEVLEGEGVRGEKIIITASAPVRLS